MNTEEIYNILKLALKTADVYLYARTPEGERDVVDGMIPKRETVAATMSALSDRAPFRGASWGVRFGALHVAKLLVRAAQHAPRCMNADGAVATLSALFNGEV